MVIPFEVLTIHSKYCEANWFDLLFKFVFKLSFIFLKLTSFCCYFVAFVMDLVFLLLFLLYVIENSVVWDQTNLRTIFLQLPALVCPGITLVISPLVSLIQDQIMHLLQVMTTIFLVQEHLVFTWFHKMSYLTWHFYLSYAVGKYTCCLFKCEHGMDWAAGNS